MEKLLKGIEPRKPKATALTMDTESQMGHRFSNGTHSLKWDTEPQFSHRKRSIMSVEQICCAKDITNLRVCIILIITLV